MRKPKAQRSPDKLPRTSKARESDAKTAPVSLPHRLEAERQSDRAEDHRHKLWERRYWAASFALAVVAVCAAAVAGVSAYLAWQAAAGQLGEAKSQADISKQSLIQSQRAWIEVSVDPSTLSLTWDKALLPKVEATVIGENMGNSPALNVKLSAEPFFAYGADDQRAYAKEICSASNFTGNMIFVHAKIARPSLSSIPAEAMQFYKLKYAVGHGIGINDVKLAPISVILCAKYNILGDPLPHLTAREYFIGPPEKGFRGFAIPVIGEDHPAGSVILRALDNSGGDFAN